MAATPSLISIQSVYSTDLGYCDIFQNEELNQEILKLRLQNSVNVGYKYSNRLDLVSFDFYETVELWWAIAVYNRIINPTSFENEVLYLFNKQDLINLIQEYNKRIGRSGE